MLNGLLAIRKRDVGSAAEENDGEIVRHFATSVLCMPSTCGEFHLSRPRLMCGAEPKGTADEYGIIPVLHAW
jgi:hypothetical protein